jgi:tetratricopeptide (TPR) repeat protein
VVKPLTGTPLPAQPLRSGIVPPLGAAFGKRPETGTELRAGLYPGGSLVLAHGEPSPAAPAVQGGTGKTQLAAAFARTLWSGRAVEMLAWVNATSREGIVSGFAQAARAVGASAADASADTAAEAFLAWLAHTRRPWALIMDDLGDLADVEDLWPSGPAGQVVITTRLPGTAFGHVPGPGRAGGPRIAPVGGFSRREALSYLTVRLTEHTDQRIEALDLGDDLDGLPLAIAQAAAMMSVTGLSCPDYRVRLRERREHMAGVLVEGVSPAVLATWSLAAECAHQLPPAGVAWPALALAAMFDPHGIPGAVLTSPAACGYVAGRPSTGTEADQNLVLAAITNLARSGLVSIDSATHVRTVQMHPSVQSAVLAYLPPAELEQVVLAAADALSQAWPEAGGGPQLEQAFRDCTAALWSASTMIAPPPGPHEAQGFQAQGQQARWPRIQPRNPLWTPAAHPLLFRRGRSLEDARLAEPAITYWQTMLLTSIRLLGNAHANAVTARDRLALAYEAAGRSGDAVAVFASALAYRERTLGTAHPETITARGQLAHAYVSAGRTAEAVGLYAQMVSDASRQLGVGHPVTLAARSNLAGANVAAGRLADALTGYQMVVTDSERLLGTSHPATRDARDRLAETFLASGQAKDAIAHYKRLLADTEGTAGPDHADTIAVRARLASAYRQGGKGKDAIALHQRVVADREASAGADHPDAMAARASLALAYRSAGQLREAIGVYERTLADRERVQGPDHADTRAARVNLASAYQQAGRLADAIGQYEQALADTERLLGPGQVETLATRSSLAAAHFADGRMMEAVALLQRALADSERYLGPDHPMTQTARENLENATRT